MPNASPTGPTILHGGSRIRFTIIVALLFTTLVAALFRTPPIVFMAAVLAAAPVFGILLVRISSRWLSVTSDLPNLGKVGDVVSGQFTLRNHSILARFPGAPAIARRGAPLHRAAGAQSPAAGNCATSLDQPRHAVPLLLPGASVAWKQRWRLERRGRHQFAPVQAGVLDPLGLQRRLHDKTEPQPMLVLPAVYKLSRLDCMVGVAGGMESLAHATMVADAVDFHGVRPLLPGEGIRRLHWKTTARTGQLHVVEWEENLTSDGTVLIDTQASCIAGEGADSSLEICITLAASICVYLLENGRCCRIFCWGPAPQAGASQGGTGSDAAEPELLRYQADRFSEVQPALEFLARLEALSSEKATLERLAAQVAFEPDTGTLVLASTLAHVSETMSILQATASRRCRHRALVLQAASFLPGGGNIPTPVHSTYGPAVRIIRKDQPLAAALETAW